MKKFFQLFAVVTMALSMVSCYTTHNVDRAPQENLDAEGTIVFTRPARYSMWFGSYSQREFIEITYENVSRNEAGMMVVEVGIRYRGPVSWTNWYRKAPPTMSLRAQCNFAKFRKGARVYSTNNQVLPLRLGETYDYKAICPVKEAGDYQLVLGEM